MQSSKSQLFPIRRVISLSLLFFVGALLWSITSMVRAQTVAGYSGSNQSITGVVSKGPGQAEITITGVALKTSLSYCLVGVGRGHWHAKKIDGNTQFDLTKVACAKSDGSKVIVPVRLDAKYYQQGGVPIGYVPVSVSANGMLVEWQPYPTGALKFEKNDGKLSDIIAIHWSPEGHAKLATAAEAMAIND